MVVAVRRGRVEALGLFAASLGVLFLFISYRRPNVQRLDYAAKPITRVRPLRESISKPYPMRELEEICSDSRHVRNAGLAT